jgi:fatty acid desaturase
MNKLLKAKSARAYESGGIAFVGCILLGAGIGWLFRTEWLVPGMIIGMGTGFITMAIMGHRQK